MALKQILARTIKGIQLIVAITSAVISIIIVGFLFWNLAGKTYLDLPFPAGGDFYNFYTYAVFFKKYLTFPTVGWIHWWNEGVPVIGGYSSLHYYLLHPFYSFFDTLMLVQLYSVTTLFLFFLGSFISFWLVGRSILLACVLTIILLFTQGVYYSLFIGGFVAAANTQWLLPFSFISLFLYVERKNAQYLTIGAIAAGFSLLFHQPTSLILIMPTSLLFLFFSVKKWKNKARSLFIFLTISILVGSISLYQLYNQLILGRGSDKCDSQLCWGLYPDHFVNFHILEVLMPMVLLGLVLLIKIVKRKVKIKPVIVFFIIFSIPVLYCVAAYYKYIDAFASAYFPRRTYWAISFFALMVGAVSYRSIKEVLPKFSMAISTIIIIAVGASYMVYPQLFSIKVEGERPGAYPPIIEQYILPKYQKYHFEDLLPPWFPRNEQNYRFHSFNQNLIVWWNIMMPMPAVLGFSNAPLGNHVDWQYFLQESLRSEQPDSVTSEVILNKAQFLLDAFAIGYIENTASTSIHHKIISNSDLSVRSGGGWNFTEFSKDIITPIVSPTNTSPVLFIGDEQGYSSFIRVAALANLNSLIMIPVSGGDNFDKLSLSDLQQFDALVLYRYKGKDWEKLRRFVAGGGKLFIESGSLPEQPKYPLPEVFPASQIKEEKQGNRTWGKEASILGIETDSFSELVFEGGPWKRLVAKPEDLRPWASQMLTQDRNVLMAEGMLGKGKVVWSGWNFLYHIVNKNDLEEAILFGNIMSDFIGKANINKPIFTVKRERPEVIKIKGENITGIYFKENYHPGWSGVTNGKKLKVYPAGLDFMYIPTSHDPASATVLIRFSGGITNWVLFFITTLTILLSTIFVLLPKPFQILGTMITLHGGRIKKGTFHYWNKDDI